ncbi:MAG: hypothetical protein MUF83_18655 [Acidimicrobiales bacterium]|nr:hypothetical protein [Acidimicrobiales bacterium]
MPEGDTIHRTAARLRPALVGRPLVRLDLPRVAGPRPGPGVAVTAVEAVGKHLLVRFDDGRVLRTHLRMSGSWHLYRAGERWQRAPHRARVVLDVGDWVAVCFDAPVVELTRDDAGTAHLGPDLCRSDADLDEALARCERLVEPGTWIADVLLDQRVAAGIGNVYKSEVLFLHRLDPTTPIEAVEAATRRALLATAATLLRANLGGSARTTAPGPPGSLWVYGRARRPCRRCGTPIRMGRGGATNRSTYWCGACQA